MGAEIEVKINTKKVIQAMFDQAMLGLEAIGATAQGYAAQDCPVDTGRLRNSITWATKENTEPKGNKTKSFRGKPLEQATTEDMTPQAMPEELAVAVGTNVEYASKVEYLSIPHKTGKAHFLRDAVTTHGDDYEKIMLAALKD